MINILRNLLIFNVIIFARIIHMNNLLNNLLNYLAKIDF